MEIELYWDSLFLIDFLANLGVLTLLKHKFSIRIAKCRILSAAIIGAVLYVCSLFVSVTGIWTKMLLMISSVWVMVYIVLPKRKRPLIWNVFLFGFLYTSVLSGILRAIFLRVRLFSGKRINLYTLLALMLVCVQIASIYIKNQRVRQTSHICKAVIESADQKITVQALIDTGNCLKEPISGKSVCLVEEPILANIIQDRSLFFRAIPFHSVGCEQGMLYGIEVSKITVVTEAACCVIEHPICAGVRHALSKNAAYQMILPPDFIEK